MLSKRSKLIKPSVTLALAAKAQAMRAQGIDVVNFTAGEPDFDTPERIKKAAIEALAKGMTKYTDVRGIEPLRAAVAEKYRREYGLRYTKDEVLVSCGGKHALYNVFQALLDEGDEVVIPAPFWVSYADMVVLVGGIPKIVPTREQNGFRLLPGQLAGALSAKTRAVILNSPSNPTGAAYAPDELEALARALLPHSCWLISDDVYEKIVYGNFPFRNVVALAPELRERTVIINSVSKTYAMTGWRIGFALGPEAVIGAAGKIQSQNTSNATSIAQAAAVEALNGPQDDVAVMVREFEKRRDFIVPRLNRIAGLRCFNPQGAFYVFPHVRSLFGKRAGGKTLQSSGDLADFLLEQARVVVVPGEDFGSSEHIRISYATSLAEIERGCDRIEQALRKLAS